MRSDVRAGTSRGIGVSTLGAALALLATAGCASNDDAAKFVGNWMFSSGAALTATCPAPIGTINQDLTGGTFSIEKGSAVSRPDAAAPAPPLVLTFNGCQLAFNVSGSRATASPANQTCSFDVPPIGGVSVTIMSWTMDEANGTTLTADVHGTALASCPVVATGTAMRSADASAGGG